MIWKRLNFFADILVSTKGVQAVEHKKRIPIPGQRIVRSVVALWLCFAVYVLRGRHGIPFYSVIAALQCIQPYNKEMRKVARKRVTGTLIGAFWGLMVLLLDLELIGWGVPDEYLHYLLLGLMVGVVLYSTVLLHATESAYFSAVVFLTVAYNHIGDANPYLFALNRVVDTILGVVLAEIVNRIQLPRRATRTPCMCPASWTRSWTVSGGSPPIPRWN